MQAVTHYQDAKIIGEVSKGLGEAMVRSLPTYQCSPRRHVALSALASSGKVNHCKVV